MKKIFTLISLCFLMLTSYAQPSGYAYGKTVETVYTEVSGADDLSDFTAVISLVDNDLRSVANGGNVESEDGYDIVFTLEDATTFIDHQIESYNPVTGEYIAWIRIPNLSASANTMMHMYYGNSAVVTDPSTTDVWGTEYGAVWHMDESPVGGGPQLIDHTSNVNDGTANGGMTASDLVSGKIGNAIDFDGSNDYFDCGDFSSSDPVDDITVSAWINSRSSNGHVINKGGGWDDPGYSLFHLSNDIRIELQRSGEKDIVDNSAPAHNEWHFVALTYNNATGQIKCFVDGVASANTGTHTGPIGNPVENLNIGRKEQNGYYFDGIIDEGRVVHAARSDDWLLTEYNNQNDPPSFYSISEEQTAETLGGGGLPIELVRFDAESEDGNTVRLSWITASELNNDFFTVEKSNDGVNYAQVCKVKGAGNSNVRKSYSVVDARNEQGTVYYRLKQTDFDGQFEYSDAVTVYAEITDLNLLPYPNPTSQYLSIQMVTINPGDVLTVYSSTGVDYTNQVTVISDYGLTQVDVSVLPTGYYFLRIGGKTGRFQKI